MKLRNSQDVLLLAHELADAVVNCYSRNGEFNMHTAPLGTLQLRQLAARLQRRLELLLGASEHLDEAEGRGP